MEITLDMVLVKNRSRFPSVMCESDRSLRLEWLGLGAHEQSPLPPIATLCDGSATGQIRANAYR